jgi:hypothetical protein
LIHARNVTLYEFDMGAPAQHSTALAEDRQQADGRARRPVRALGALISTRSADLTAMSSAYCFFRVDETKTV